MAPKRCRSWRCCSLPAPQSRGGRYGVRWLPEERTVPSWADGPPMVREDKSGGSITKKEHNIASGPSGCMGDIGKLRRFVE
jgi:hypothetical protein